VREGQFSAFLPTPTLNPVRVGGIIEDTQEFTFEAQLSEELPADHGVFLNFDNLNGGWLLDTDDGGHIELPDQGSNTFTKDTSLNKLGIRFFRAAIFDLKGDNVPGNDVRVSEWSNIQTCTLPLCLSMVSRPNNYGNPAVTGSGSRLFKNVDVANGNYHLSKVDISVSGKGPSFNFSRAYNSGHSSPWSFSYEMTAQFLGNYNREIAIGPREDGHMQYFFKDMNSEWHSLNPGDFDKLAENGDGSFNLYTQGNRIYEFTDPNSSTSGRLRVIKDRLNLALSFGYDVSNNLDTVTDTNGRVYDIRRDINNRIDRVTDFSGRYVGYTYNADGMLTDVRKMRGDTVVEKYSYISTLLLNTITDPMGNLQLTISYHVDDLVEKLTDGVNNETSFIYGNSTKWGGNYTGIEQPQVDSINANRVYVLDDKRTKVVEMYDAKSAADALASGDIITVQEYKEPRDNTHFGDMGLVTKTTNPNNNDTIIAYNDTIDGGRPQQITNAKSENTQANYNASETSGGKTILIYAP